MVERCALVDHSILKSDVSQVFSSERDATDNLLPVKKVVEQVDIARRFPAEINKIEYIRDV